MLLAWTQGGNTLMATNLMETIESYLTPDVMQKVSGARRGEPRHHGEGARRSGPLGARRSLGMGSSGSGASQLMNLITGSNTAACSATSRASWRRRRLAAA